MCLDRLDPKVRPRKVGGKIYAWKVLDVRDDQRLAPPWFGNDRSTPIGVWLNSKAYSNRQLGIRCRFDNHIYQPGFHAYVKKEDALSELYTFRRARKIELQDVVATGWQEGMEVVVAKRMKILPEKKRGK